MLGGTRSMQWSYSECEWLRVESSPAMHKTSTDDDLESCKSPAKKVFWNQPNFITNVADLSTVHRGLDVTDELCQSLVAKSVPLCHLFCECVAVHNISGRPILANSAHLNNLRAVKSQFTSELENHFCSNAGRWCTGPHHFVLRQRYTA